MEFILKRKKNFCDAFRNNYCPKVNRKLLSIAKIIKSIDDKIYADIIKNHSDWGQGEINKGFEESYNKVLNFFLIVRDLNNPTHLWATIQEI